MFKLLLGILFILCACGQNVSFENDLPLGEEPTMDWVREFDLSSEKGSTIQDGDKLSWSWTKDVFKYVRVWFVGNKENIRHIYFCVHGDGASDYSTSTVSDRKALDTWLKARGEGGLVLLPIATGTSWPAFQGREKQRKNNKTILRVFRELEYQALMSCNPEVAGPDTCSKPVTFELFSLSGGGRFNHAVLRLIIEHYPDDFGVKAWVKDNIKILGDGEAMSYDIDGADGLRESWIQVLKNYPWLRAGFVHATESRFEYMWKEHIKIGKAFGGKDFCRGCTQTLEDGRLRFWPAKTHWTTWQGQWTRMFTE